MIPSLDNKETPPPRHGLPNFVDIYDYFGLDDLDILYSDFELKPELSQLHKLRVLTQRISDAFMDFSDSIGISEMGSKMQECGKNIGFDSDGKIVSADFCRLRFCPMCQKRRSLKVYARFCEILDLLDDKAFLHLVLTCPNTDASNLNKTIDNLFLASSALFKLEPVSKAFLGVARVLEVSYNPDRSEQKYHPHLHCLVCVNKSYFTSRSYLKRETLQRYWKALFDTYANGFNPKKNPKFGLVSSMAAAYDKKELYQVYISKADKGALPEIAKYTLKPLDIRGDIKDYVHIIEELYPAMHNRRAIQLYGIIRTVAKAETLTGDEPEQANKCSFAFRWSYTRDINRYSYLRADVASC